MERSSQKCACGCGLTTLLRGNKPRKFIAGHESGKFAPERQKKQRKVKPPRIAKPRKTHGMSDTPEYTAFHNAMKRCDTDPDWVCFPSYAAKGIRFEFNSFEEWFAELGFRPSPEHSVDRINPLGNYCKGNVRWSTKDVQMANRRGQWYVYRESIESLDNGYPEEIGFLMHAQWVCPVNNGASVSGS